MAGGVRLGASVHVPPSAACHSITPDMQAALLSVGQAYSHRQVVQGIQGA